MSLVLTDRDRLRYERQKKGAEKAIAQLSDMVIGLERDQQEDNEQRRNTTTVRILKNRYAGLTGACCYLKYNNFTGRMTETAKPKEVDSGL